MLKKYIQVLGQRILESERKKYSSGSKAVGEEIWKIPWANWVATPAGTISHQTVGQMVP